MPPSRLALSRALTQWTRNSRCTIEALRGIRVPPRPFARARPGIYRKYDGQPRNGGTDGDCGSSDGIRIASSTQGERLAPDLPTSILDAMRNPSSAHALYLCPDDANKSGAGTWPPAPLRVKSLS